MVKTPDTDQFPWSPFQVFQFKLVPNTGTFSSPKKYTTVGGVHKTYGVITRGPNAGKQYERSHYLGMRQRAEAFNDIYKGFNRPYYTSRLGGSFTGGRFTPDTFTVVIGVVDKSLRHEGQPIGEGQDGDTLKYDVLFELLDNLNFKPLTVLLKNEKKINSEIEKCVLKIVKSKGVLSKQTFIDKLSVVAGKWTEEVRSYIYGSDTPPLKDKTVDYFREKKKAINPSLYGSGDDKSLVESGQLAEAIDFEVFVDQSAEIKTFIKWQSKVEKRMREEAKMAEKKRKKRIEDRERSRAKKRNRKIEEAMLSSDAKTLEEFEDFAERHDREIIAKNRQRGDDMGDIVSMSMNKITDFQRWVRGTRAVLGPEKVWPQYVKDEANERLVEYRQAISILRDRASREEFAAIHFLQTHGIPL